MLNWDNYPTEGITYNPCYNNHNHHHKQQPTTTTTATTTTTTNAQVKEKSEEEEKTENEDEDEEDEIELEEVELKQQISTNSSNEDEGVEDLQPKKDKEDQYRAYYYEQPIQNARLNQTSTEVNKSDNKHNIDVFRNLRRNISDPWEVLFMRAEGLHAHGHHREASQIARHLAEELLKNPPDLLRHHNNQDKTGNNNNKKSVKAASHHITHTASTTLGHCAFLCQVLTENPAHHHLAFQVGLFGLELARPPASTKPMEVRLAHQEAELVLMLKKIPLQAEEMSVIRDRAMQLRDGTLRSRGEALLPLMMAAY